MDIFFPARGVGGGGKKWSKKDTFRISGTDVQRDSKRKGGGSHEAPPLLYEAGGRGVNPPRPTHPSPTLSEMWWLPPRSLSLHRFKGRSRSVASLAASKRKEEPDERFLFSTRQVSERYIPLSNYTPGFYMPETSAGAAKALLIAWIRGNINSACDKLEIDHEGIRVLLDQSQS